MAIDLTVVWAFIIAFAVFAYVVMDGFDLGIGVLFPTFAVGQERGVQQRHVGRESQDRLMQGKVALQRRRDTKPDMIQRRPRRAVAKCARYHGPELKGPGCPPVGRSRVGERFGVGREFLQP